MTLVFEHKKPDILKKPKNSHPSKLIQFAPETTPLVIMVNLFPEITSVNAIIFSEKAQVLADICYITQSLYQLTRKSLFVGAIRLNNKRTTQTNEGKPKLLTLNLYSAEFLKIY